MRGRAFSRLVRYGECPRTLKQGVLAVPFRSSLLISLICATVLVTSVTGANAITVEVAKKCQILREKQFPPREIGNPAAGSAKGSSRDQLEFFRKCVANGGNMESTTEKNKQ
jgi:hypothetical protein